MTEQPDQSAESTRTDEADETTVEPGSQSETTLETGSETSSETGSETGSGSGSAGQAEEPADSGAGSDRQPDEDTDEDSDEDTDEDSDEDSDEEGSEENPGGRVERLETEGDIAADYLEELLDIADLDGDLDMDVDGDRASVSIVGADLQQLVGRNGEVLDALQELTRLAVYRETGERSRLMLDVSGYRAEKREQLVALAKETVARVKESGERAALQPMTPFERKVVHDAVAAEGLVSESDGVEPHRHVVVLPA